MSAQQLFPFPCFLILLDPWLTAALAIFSQSHCFHFMGFNYLNPPVGPPELTSFLIPSCHFPWQRNVYWTDFESDVGFPNKIWRWLHPDTKNEHSDSVSSGETFSFSHQARVVSKTEFHITQDHGSFLDAPIQSYKCVFVSHSSDWKDIFQEIPALNSWKPHLLPNVLITTLQHVQAEGDSILLELKALMSNSLCKL